ncbi:MAG: zf-HC2 domain-containing protein [Chloroflexi bacterium]|nr:zf-HC2 domain-containing protein [Chloroflexota bacterium]MDA1240447.1 zf-HC2 domain-containing protein [Chloroflexota bacterium]MQC48179.1 hypothetical protein [Chloroflexota bacterium]
MNRWQRRDLEAPSTPLERLEERLSAYLDGELTDAERSAVEVELAADAETRETLDDLRLVRSALALLDEGVRAPRSFAITAPAVRSGGGSPVLMRRLELFMRGSAAAAALFFVVAVMNQPTLMAPVASNDMATGTFAQAESAPVETLRAAATDDPAVTPMFAPDAMQPASAPARAMPAAPPTAGGEPGEGGVMGTAADGGLGGDAGALDAPKGNDVVPQPDADLMNTMLTPETATAPAQPGTFRDSDSSQGVGGVAPALATLAVLLAILSALTAWSRREESGR